MRSHIHCYKIESKKRNIHNHKLSGYVDGMIGFNNLHFHFFYGVSSYLDHTHYFSGLTGMPVKTEKGHIHKMEGMLESNGFHSHSFSGYTSEEVSYISGILFGKAYI
jgi:hypothetical protein